MKLKIKNKINFSNVLSIISILLNTYLLNLILKIDIIPAKYTLVVAGIIYVFNIIFIVFSKIKKIRIVGYILLIIMIISSIIGIFYLNSTNNFLNKAFENASNINEINYYVIVNKDSNYKNINDLKSNKLYYYNEERNINKAINKLKTKTDFSKNTYEDISLMFEDLKSNKISFVLVSQVYYDLITTIDDNYSKDNYKVLYKFKLSEKLNVSKSTESDSFNIFIGGRDFTNTNMDFNMIMTINTKTHEVLFTSMPRDYYIEVDGYNGKKDTLSYMGALGITTNMKSIEKLFNTKIDYYLSVKTSSLVRLVDEVGGINYCSEQEYTTTHALILDSYDDTKGKKLFVKKGCQHLNGIETLTVARERIAHKGGDRQRQKNCQAIIIDIFEQLISTNTITNYNNILNSVSDLYETTIPKKVITNVIKDTVNNGNKWKFETQSVNGEDTKDYVHMTNLKDWVTYPDMNTVNNASIKINQVLNNK